MASDRQLGAKRSLQQYDTVQYNILVETSPPRSRRLSFFSHSPILSAGCHHAIALPFNNNPPDPWSPAIATWNTYIPPMQHMQHTQGCSVASHPIHPAGRSLTFAALAPVSVRAVRSFASRTVYIHIYTYILIYPSVTHFLGIAVF